MTGLEVVGVFVGIPAAVMLLIALPIFGPEWWRGVRARTGAGARRHEPSARSAGPPPAAPACDDHRVTTRVRRSGPADRTAILALMTEARGNELTAAEKAERGFVQGAMTPELLARFELGPGVFVAEDDGELAGFAMTSEPGAVTSGPPQQTADAAREHLGRATRLFLYGPAAVDRRFQGRGVLTALLAGLSGELAGRFDRGAAFVETANAKSLAVHRHLGMTEVARFDHDHRDYVVLTFDPADLARLENCRRGTPPPPSPS